MGWRARGTLIRALLGAGASGTLGPGCLPDRELSSYATGRDVPGDSVVNAGSPAPTAPAPGPVAPLGAEVDDSSLESSPDAGAPRQDAPSPIERDAAPERTLSCRTDCDCERRGDRDFMFCAETVSFAEAGERCAAAGGTLASIEDAALDDWLTEQMQARSADDFWLSGTDAEEEGVWRWADGSVFYPSPADAGGAFASWDAEQPNDLNGEDCMRSVGGLWRDLACDLDLAYVCQG
jgi:lectin-like protein